MRRVDSGWILIDKLLLSTRRKKKRNSSNASIGVPILFIAVTSVILGEYKKIRPKCHHQHDMVCIVAKLEIEHLQDISEIKIICYLRS